MHFENWSARELAQGYARTEDGYRCAACGCLFAEGEVYPLDGHFYTAARAVVHHVAREHGDYLQTQLIDSDSKYSTLTENQRRLLHLFAQGVADKEIARQLGISVSTVRHQKFVFREKAKQAKFYLAVYEGVFGQKAPADSAIIPIHSRAKKVDERYVVTEEERAHILETAFSSLDPPRLRSFSPKEKKKIVILAQIAGAFVPGRRYSEREVSEVLAAIYGDFATLRRYLIEYGFMERTKDGSAYWLGPGTARGPRPPFFCRARSAPGRMSLPPRRFPLY